MTVPTPDGGDGVWIWIPIIRDPNTARELNLINTQLGAIMAQVQVDSQQLTDLDSALDAVAQSLADKIAALQLPTADLQPLLDDVEVLRGLAAPTPEPPAA